MPIGGTTCRGLAKRDLTIRALTAELARERGWSPRGRPLFDKVSHGDWKTLTFLAGFRQSGIVAALVLDDPINGLAFTAWVEQFLVHTLSSGDVVIFDNTSEATTARLPGGPSETPAAPTSSSCRPTALTQPDRDDVRQALDPRPQGRNQNRRGNMARVGTLLRAFPPDECASYIRHADYASG